VAICNANSSNSKFITLSFVNVAELFGVHTVFMDVTGILFWAVLRGVMNQPPSQTFTETFMEVMLAAVKTSHHTFMEVVSVAMKTSHHTFMEVMSVAVKTSNHTFMEVVSRRENLSYIYGAVAVKTSHHTFMEVMSVAMKTSHH
jgi:hypothetical protein